MRGKPQKKEIPLRMVKKKNPAPPGQFQVAPQRKSVPGAQKWLFWRAKPQIFGVDTRIFIMVLAGLACCWAFIGTILNFLAYHWLLGCAFLCVMCGVGLVLLGAALEQKIVVIIGAAVVACLTCALILLDFILIILLATDTSAEAFTGSQKRALDAAKEVFIVFAVVDICYLICCFCPLAVVSFGYANQLP